MTGPTATAVPPPDGAAAASAGARGEGVDRG